MNKYLNFFLKINRWQLFCLLIVLPYILNILLVINIETGAYLPVPVFLISFLFVIAFLSWLYSLAINLHKKLPENVTLNLKKFKILFFILIFYLIIFVSFIYFVFNKDTSQNGQIMLPFMLFHCFAMYCMFYILYFVAKTMKSVEMQKTVTFNDYAGEFFLIWFFPIGIWFLQPRINKIFGFDKSNNQQMTNL